MRDLGLTLASGEAVYDRTRSHLHDGAVALLPEALAAIESRGRDFFVAAHDFGRVVGKTTCVETGEDDEVVFARREGRFGFTRFVKNREAEDSTMLVVVLKQVSEGYLLITSFIGRPAPPEPWDANADENSGPFWESHALLWGSEKIVAGTELPATPASPEPGQDTPEHLTEVLEAAWAWGLGRHPDATKYHHAAFANSVGEAVTGWAGGYGGPSIRQYTSVGEVIRMGRFSGQTAFAEACVILEEVCYGPIRDTHIFACVDMGAFPGELTFDDAPDDIESFWQVVQRLPEHLRARVEW